MSYIQNTLVGDEKIIYQGKVSKWYLLRNFLLAVVCLIVSIAFFANGSSFGGLIALLVGIVSLIGAYLFYISTELAFTNKRVIAKMGFISRATIELNINKVESIQVHQGIFGRMLDFGSIIIAGAGNPQAPIFGISSPMKFRNAFMNYTNK